MSHVRGVLAVLGDNFRMTADGKFSGNAKIEVIILAGSQLLIETDHSIKNFPSVDYRRMHSNVVCSQQVQIMFILNAWPG
jgi:hypothetical protein